VGKTPVDVEKSIRIIAKANGLSLSEIAAATTKNLKEFFYI
jgi:Tat protein secretion system quality control protein TatD with DNase activity